MWNAIRRDGKRSGQLCGAVTLCLSLGALAACSDILDVELPTRVPAETLDDPSMANVLVEGGVSDFECAFTNYVAATGLLTDELIGATGWIAPTMWDQRRIFPNNGNLGTGDCTDLGYGVYTPLQTARFQSEDAFQRIQEFPDVDVPGKESLLATAAAYAGYSYTILGEAFCEMAVDQGPLLQPEEVLARAEEWFTTAIDLAQASGNEDVLHLARVGRARVRLDLGLTDEAAADAALVPEGFTGLATRSAANEQRWNRVAVDTYRNFYISVDPSFRDLTVDGVADPRVPVVDAAQFGHDGITPIFAQAKYTAEGDPIPLASWEEAQLILGEAALAAGNSQGAVDAINRLRTAAGLPPFGGGDSQAVREQLIEERRRELFLEGHRLNDMLRLGIPFEEGRTHKGVAFGPTTCLPLPDAETTTNPNL